MAYPSFLCIGAAKAGTTWLWANLRAHPQVWLPPYKEMRYFAGDWKRDFRPNKEWYYFKSALRYGYFRWYLRYRFLPRSDRWYASLFPDDPIVSGDITPEYALVERAGVAQVYELMPQAKILYMLRNPIDQAWSWLAMALRHEGISDWRVASEEMISRILTDPIVNRHSRFTKTLDNWSSVYPEDRIFVGYYDQLVEAPEVLLAAVQDFLGLPYYADVQIVKKVVARGTYSQPSSTYREFLAQRHLAEIQAILLRFDNRFTRSWLESAMSVL